MCASEKERQRDGEEASVHMYVLMYELNKCEKWSADWKPSAKQGATAANQEIKPLYSCTGTKKLCLSQQMKSTLPNKYQPYK